LFYFLIHTIDTEICLLEHKIKMFIYELNSKYISYQCIFKILIFANNLLITLILFLLKFRQFILHNNLRNLYYNVIIYFFKYYV
jgi:hypothetical protein